MIAMKKRIEGFPDYTIDQNGVVFNERTQRVVKRQYNVGSGYVYVMLYNNGLCKRALVHRLVALAFIPNPSGLPCVNHKDENKANCSVENLEWCSYQYNNHYGKAPTMMATTARKRPVVQYDKDGNYIADYESASEAERATGIRSGNISKCCLGRKCYKSAGGYIWKFE